MSNGNINYCLKFKTLEGFLYLGDSFEYFSYWKLIKLQKKSQEIKTYLNGRCIYLVGQFLYLYPSPLY